MFSLYHVLVSLLSDQNYGYEPCGKIWSDGEQLLTETESAANTLADLIDLVDDYCTTTGYYDPDEDKRNGELADFLENVLPLSEGLGRFASR